MQMATASRLCRGQPEFRKASGANTRLAGVVVDASLQTQHQKWPNTRSLGQYARTPKLTCSRVAGRAAAKSESDAPKGTRKVAFYQRIDGRAVGGRRVDGFAMVVGENGAEKKEGEEKKRKKGREKERARDVFRQLLGGLTVDMQEPFGTAGQSLLAWLRRVLEQKITSHTRARGRRRAGGQVNRPSVKRDPGSMAGKQPTYLPTREGGLGGLDHTGQTM